jgi:hypothetical protein
LILKEKDFREYIKVTDWSVYKDKFVAIQCSVDAIVPTWAYMLLALALNNFARKIIYGTLEELESQLYFDSLANVEWEQFKDLKIVIKGCSKINVPLSAYVEVCNKLKSRAVSIMFGEPCSTVPLYKKAKLNSNTIVDKKL